MRKTIREQIVFILGQLLISNYWTELNVLNKEGTLFAYYNINNYIPLYPKLSEMMVQKSRGKSLAGRTWHYFDIIDSELLLDKNERFARSIFNGNDQCSALWHKAKVHIMHRMLYLDRLLLTKLQEICRVRRHRILKLLDVNS